MAEIIGTISAVTALAAEGIRLARTINIFVKEIKGASKEAQKTADEVTSTSIIIEQFSKNFELERKTRLCEAKFYNQTNGSIAECKSIFEDLHGILEKAAPGLHENGIFLRKRMKLLWPFLREDIVSIEKRLVKVKTDMQFQLTLMIHAHQIQTDIDAKEKSDRDEVRAKRSLVSVVLEESLPLN